MAHESGQQSALPPALKVSRRGLFAGSGLSAMTGAGMYSYSRSGTLAWQQTPAPDPPRNGGTPTAPPGVVATPRIPGTPTAEKIDPADVIEEISVPELRGYLDDGAFTILDLVDACIERINDLDHAPTNLRAVIELNPDARAIARELDEELLQGAIRGPLHGIPVVLKDIVATADEMKTTAGSLALEDNIVTQDAFIVTRLREAGAVILGKANLTEWSNFMGSSGVSGWSARGGQTVNPYHLDYSPGGSSSGSAVAVAASYVPLAIGSETNGSIIAPASSCGVVGMKPTVGLTSRAGVIPISFSQDSPGPMARSVTDAAMLLSVIAGHDEDEPSAGIAAESSPAAELTASQVQALGTTDYASSLDRDGLRGARIGVCRSLFGFQPRADEMAERAIAVMADAGAKIIEDIYITSLDTLPNGYAVLLTEFAWGLVNFLQTSMPDGPVTTIQEIVDFNLEHADEELVVTDQSGLTDALGAAGIDDPFYLETRATRQSLMREQGIDALMEEHDLDAFVAPSASIAALLAGDLNVGNGEDFGTSAEPASIAGYPSLTLPIGLSDGLPAGLHFFGRAFSEETLLKLAYGLEQALPPREAPTYIPRGEPFPEG